MSLNIQDIHTHNLPAVPGTALFNLPLGTDTILTGHYYSAGLHPWNVQVDYSSDIEWVESMLGCDDVLALGEVGLDRLHGPSIDVQMKALNAQLKLACRYGKPVVLHIVRAYEELLRLDIPSATGLNCAIHGFRGKPQLARDLIRHGYWLSFGMNFNSASIASVPDDRLLIETDEFPDVNIIYDLAAAARGIDASVFRQQIAHNASVFLGL